MRKKIAVIGLKGLPAFGGAATVGEHIIKELSNEYDFTVYAMNSHAAVADMIYCKQIIFKTSKFYSFNTFLYYIKSAFHALVKGNYDVVHLHHYSGTYIVPILRLKFKVITTTHGSNVFTHKKLEKFFLTFIRDNFLMKSNMVTNVSLSEHRFFQQKGKETIYIPNGINPIKYLPHNIEKEFDIVFSANRIIYLKGLHLIFQAMKSINKDLKILVIGDARHSPQYVDGLIKEYSDLNIEFTGLLKDKNELFSKILKSKIFIFPSYTEAMSMMLLEVASLGVPIVCSDIEANIDIFNEHEVLFFKSEDAINLQEKIEWAITNDILMKEKAIKAKKKVEEKYLWSEIAKDYRKQYEKLIHD